MLWILLCLVILAVALLVNYYIAKEFYAVAEAKGYYDQKYLWICFFLGAAGYLLVIALPNRKATQAEDTQGLPEL